MECIEELSTAMCYMYLIFIQVKDKNSAEVDIAPAFGEITTACNVGQAKKVMVRA